ncbi:hypothetical protein [Alteribacter populi]|uniref:hypothetical protein n=1 Tax=Alteribacter populi TaxID=2011011 RepID=UPI000BBAA515|nr:hypothetical protein [Alteribacter populi]
MDLRTEFMVEAYRLHYELENNLRWFIRYRMENDYGKDWERALQIRYDYSNAYFHDLISLLFKYPNILIKLEHAQRKLLISTIPIRNKIAHAKVLTNKEFKQLEKAHQFIDELVKH